MRRVRRGWVAFGSGSTPHAGSASLGAMKPESRRLFLTAALALASGVLGFLLGRGPLATAPVPDGRPSGRAPLIGIASLTAESYASAVREAGGIPVVLPNAPGSVARVPDYLLRLDGLLMPGGADIPPSEYGEEAHESVALLDESRFEFEKALVTAWMNETDKPLLGICLGSQWINVAAGGSLVQDIPSEIGTDHREPHSVVLEPDSRLARIFGTTELEVNSHHHQAAKRIGSGLRAVAKAPDGVVEATESTDPDRFLIGVQWHPEKMMPEDSLQTKLLEAFVEASAGWRRRR